MANSVFAAYSGESGTFLRKSLRSAGSIAADAGYMDPIRPEETDKFWDELRK
jgi:hypothetical protein